MPRLTRFSIAKGDIVKYLNSLQPKVLKADQLAGIFEENRENWRLAKSMTHIAFIEELILKTKLKEVELPFPSGTIKLFTYGEISPYELASHLKPKSYISHYTAMSIHQLTEQLPKVIYVTQEQSQKNIVRRPLLQASINMAYEKPQRVSENYVVYSGYTIFLLNGMYTNNAGVIEYDDPIAGKLFITNIERTLIDSVVRPAYSGGIGEVLNAFEKAKNIVSINKLNAILTKINYIYPYQQAIGFYLEKAGYRDSQINIFKKNNFNYDFYLTHGMSEVEYSPTWKLYFPKGL